MKRIILTIFKLALTICLLQAQNNCTDNTTLTDIDGNVYNTVNIGKQIWMAENLKTTRYADGTIIPKVSGHYSWNLFTAKNPAYCWYYNDSITYAGTYGALYTWFGAMKGSLSSAANPSGIQGVCPTGWHLPSDAEWTELEIYLQNNGYNYDGTIDTDQERSTMNKIAKSLTATFGWSASSDAGVPGNTDYPAYHNKSGFSAHPGGYRHANATFYGAGMHSYWWSSTEFDAEDALYRTIIYCFSDLSRYDCHKNSGLSVRCVKD